MEFKFKNNKLFMEFPNKNKGKFRYKKKGKSELSRSFSPIESKFEEDIYLEWQIGYDALLSDINKKKHCLIGKKFEFIGANGKKKYPYELSKILWTLVKKNILKPTVFNHLKNKIIKYNDFFDNVPKIKIKGPVGINNLTFTQATTLLPTYYFHPPDQTWIEIIIQKQQYAFSFQAMIYYCIPIRAFKNGNQLIGFSSKEKPIPLQYMVDKNNTNNILTLFKTLAMASKRHKQDVLKILNVLENTI